MVFRWSLSDNKSPQVSRTLLSILTNLNNTVVWMVSTSPLISKSSSSLINLLVTVPRAPITIGIRVHVFFYSLAKSRYVSLFLLSFNFSQWSAGTAKSTIRQVLFFLVVWARLGDLFISHLLLLFTPLEFFTSVFADGFSLEFEWQQVSSSLPDSSHDSGRSQQCCHLDSLYPSPTSKSSRPFNNPLVIVPKAPITIGTIVTFMFHSFFNSLARSRYLSLFSHSFRFILLSAGTAKSTILQILFFPFFFFFLLIIIKSGLLAGIRWSICMLKSYGSFYYYYDYYYYYFTLLWAFHTSVSWVFLTGVWVTASLLKCPGFSSIF